MIMRFKTFCLESSARFISFVAVIIILFLLYFSMNNISTWIMDHGDGTLTTNFLAALFDSIIIAIYSIFIIEYIRPAKFNLKITIVVMIGLIIFLIFTIFLI